MTAPLSSRRKFLRQTVAFSAVTAYGRLASALASAQTFDAAATHILLVGDWGATNPEKGQRQVSAGMMKYAQQHELKPESLWLLGDSWYGSLDGGADSRRWQTQFEQMYPATVFPGPAYSIMGNHDYQRMPLSVNKVHAELEYARRGHSRWKQPALWYTFDVTAQDGSPLLHVVALDSNAPLKIEMFDPVDFTLSARQWQQQKAWLASELARPTSAPFTLVLGHHPIYSNGPHGDHAMLIADWEPLLRQHKVAAYIAGHDHDLQHLEFAGHPTSFVCSGAGGADLYDIKIAESQRGPFAHKVFGFTHLEATAARLTFRHIDVDGKVLHSFTKSLDGTVALA